jgi:hypothetical protein
VGSPSPYLKNTREKENQVIRVPHRRDEEISGNDQRKRKLEAVAVCTIPPDPNAETGYSQYDENANHFAQQITEHQLNESSRQRRILHVGGQRFPPFAKPARQQEFCTQQHCG